MLKRSLVILVVIIAIPAFAKNGDTPEQIIRQKHVKLMEKIKSIEATTLKSWIENEKNFILLDVRETNELNTFKITTENRMEISRGVVDFRFHQMVPDKEALVVVACSHGWRSAAVTDLLSGYGYKNIYNLKDGIFAWINAGYRVANFYGTFEIKDFKSTL